MLEKWLYDNADIKPFVLIKEHSLNGSGAHPASGLLFLVVKQAKCEATHLHSVQGLKMSGALVLLHTNLCGIHMGNFIPTNKQDERAQK